MIFVEGDKISEEFILESQHSHKIQLDFEGDGIGYYKIFMPEFLKYKVLDDISDNLEQPKLEAILQNLSKK